MIPAVVIRRHATGLPQGRPTYCRRVQQCDQISPNYNITFLPGTLTIIQMSHTIALERSANGILNTGGTSRTIPFTVTGSNTLLLVGWGHDDLGKVTSVTFNGVPLVSLAVQQFDTFRDKDFNVGLYYLLSPSPGTHDLVINRDISSINDGLCRGVVHRCQTIRTA